MKFPSIPGFDQQAFVKYFKNTGWLLIGRVGSLLIKMIAAILIANYLGREQNGMLTGAVVYVYFFASIASLGLDQFIVKELHQFPANRDSILGTSFFLKIFAGLACVPLIFLAYNIYPLQATPYLFVFILSFTGIFQAFTVVDSYFQSQVQSKYIMRVQVFGNLIASLFKFGLIWLKMPILWFVFAALLDVVLLSAGYFLTYQNSGRSVFNWKFEFPLARKLVQFSWPLIVSGIMVSVYMKVDQVMIQNMVGVKEAGAYATVAQLSEAWYFIPIAIVSSLFPAILNAKRDDEERYKKRLQDLYDLMVLLSLPLALIITFASPLIYRLYKPEYAYAAPVLSVHIWAGIFVFLGTASSQFLIAENYIKLTFIRTGVGAIVNIVLNLILIPKMGMMGAAVATLFAYATATFFILFIPRIKGQGMMMLKSLFLISLMRKSIKK